MMMLYGGPDQIIPLTGILGTVFGFAMVFWSKIVIFFDKLIKSLSGRNKATEEQSELQETGPKS